ncbi:hypothetical protein ACFFJT_06760 [Dyella flava]|uniref:HEPN AbiU2-like domain-containing protein n=1 Tax=Dyella flava TaxID=1920170 RepID=A0ABS2JYR9_9GAMM|nr:hypothetical protein [Dyella flava]MBM7124147.1 hypothetical protein [Dyella flava]GLQ50049.1 hypothetical protein GCM10010872_14980 [Dyella flava]
MNVKDNRDALVEKYKQVRVAVDAAFEQAAQAVMFHETWRPTAEDADLVERMGTSFATHAFQITRWALRRELVMALMRMWDGGRSASSNSPMATLSIKHISTFLRDKDSFDVLAQERSGHLGHEGDMIAKMICGTLQSVCDSVLPQIDKYLPGGTGHQTFEDLRKLRNKRLAHHDIAGSVELTDPTDAGIEDFYRDTLEIVSLLMHLVKGVACDMGDTISIYAMYARYFWASARGERTEGHPQYKSSPIEFEPLADK